jgi:UDP-4-amino-4-deoxy-L-arabinose formyltransferase/UDP-glucuronic acid dehydrogenase (UDP-4-keto-hexauronic acid decarboxylating)
MLQKLAHGKLRGRKQDLTKGFYRGKRTPGDGNIYWLRTVKEIKNLVRAVTWPYPGAGTWFSRPAEERIISGSLKVYRPEVELEFIYVWVVTGRECDIVSKVGTVLSTDPFRVVCADGYVDIKVAQLEGDVVKSGVQVAQELSLVPGDRLGWRG